VADPVQIDSSYALFGLEIVTGGDSNCHFPGSKIFRLYLKMW